MSDLTLLIRHIQSLPAFQDVVEALVQGRPVPVVEDPAVWAPNLALPRAARVPVALALYRGLARPVLVLVADEDRAWFWSQELARWAGQVEPFPVWVGGVDAEAEAARARTLVRLAARVLERNGPPPLVVASAAGLWRPTWPRHAFLRGMKVLRSGWEVSLVGLARHLEAVGYEPVTTVVAVGQFARRGGLLDVWPPTLPHPVRVDFFGDEVERLRPFDPETQRTLAHDLERVWLPPLRWQGARPSGSVLEMLPPQTLVLVEDADAFRRRWEVLEAQEPDEEEALLDWAWEEVRERLSGRVLALGPIRQGPVPYGLAGHFTTLPRFGGQLKRWFHYVQGLVRTGAQVWVASRQKSRLRSYWREHGGQGPVHFGDVAVGEGFGLLERPVSVSGEAEPRPRHVLITDAEVFGWAPPRPARAYRPPARTPEHGYADLRIGDYVVHVDHGIGRFRGLVRRSLEGVPQEYLLVEYAEGDQLFVPVDQADRLTRYVGPEGFEPTLTRLGTGQWQVAKAKARRAALEAARDLLELYAKRQTVQGHAFSPDTEWQRELEARFPFELTEDQRRALEAVKADMEKPRPMDRLICGDAGFGKTEVALRAAFKAVMDGKQVAMLVPTTVLAQQHYRTFRERMASFPVEVAMLSRFLTPQEQARVLRGLAEGTVDIVIGTHRLLSPDVQFKDLGLVIIDEEHRFGVMQKEHFKRLRTQVDVLSLSATPIPRTLYMALTGVRDVSIIRTPPRFRKPVVTHVGPYEPEVVQKAIRRELGRGGQVFYVHNRVATIETVAHKVKRLVPEARVAVAHGQMPEGELARIMERFVAGEFDVLVCTTIIESGLDLHRVNTLIVEQAEHFGLAQLYQLRGRVGRGHRRGYAYFFWSPVYTPSEEARERLQLLAEHTELGSGFTLALHDLEIRGAGDLLGTRQHGHMAAVGYHLYMQLLTEAVQQLRRSYGLEPVQAASWTQRWTRPPVRLDLPLPATLPPSYVPDEALRLALYRRLAATNSLAEVDALAREMEDRFGPLPEVVRNLLNLVRIKVLAHAAGALSVGATSREVVIRFPENRSVPLPPMPRPVVTGRHTYRFPKDPEGHWVRRVMAVLQAVAEKEATLRDE